MVRCAGVHRMWVPYGYIQGPVAVFHPVVRKVIPVPHGLSVPADNEPLLILKELYNMCEKFLVTFL